MLKRIALLLPAVVLCLGAAACKKETTKAEKRAQEVKEFRIAQKKKAIKAYEDLAAKYPDSEFAPKAKERLQQIAPPATPKK